MQRDGTPREEQGRVGNRSSGRRGPWPHSDRSQAREQRPQPGLTPGPCSLNQPEKNRRGDGAISPDNWNILNRNPDKTVHMAPASSARSLSGPGSKAEELAQKRRLASVKSPVTSVPGGWQVPKNGVTTVAISACYIPDTASPGVTRLTAEETSQGIDKADLFHNCRVCLPQ